MKKDFSIKETLLLIVITIIGWGFFLNSQGGLSNSFSHRNLEQTVLLTLTILFSVITAYTAISVSIRKSKILSLLLGIITPLLTSYIIGNIWSLIVEGTILQGEGYIIMIFGIVISIISPILWLIKYIFLEKSPTKI